VIGVCGDKNLDTETNAFTARGFVGSSMTRGIGTMRAVANFAASEQGLTLNSRLAGVYNDRDAGASGQSPILATPLITVQAKCRESI
jgi:hypothetical protein